MTNCFYQNEKITLLKNDSEISQIVVRLSCIAASALREILNIFNIIFVL